MAATKPPSMATSETELAQIQKYSYIVPDTMLFSEDSPIKAKAEATSIRLLGAILDSTGQLANMKVTLLAFHPATGRTSCLCDDVCVFGTYSTMR